MIFLDEAAIDVQAGAGGNGCIAFRREKFVPRGGPAGGDGGQGGSVIAVGAERLNTLHHLRFSSLFKAERGRHGEGSNRAGRSGADLEIPLPLGTVVSDAGSGEVLGEILSDGERLVIARGGRGGKGNAHFATATRQAPRFAQPGEDGEARRVRLELKLLADVGTVGLPNAGKSTLISAVTAAKPKIADYPFTTLVPQLGVVAPRDRFETFVIADLPGLIAGAAQGAGLGHRFLRHVERCRVLLHLVDLSAGGLPADEELAVVERELAAFDPELLRRPRLVVGTKIDALDAEREHDLRAAAESRGLPYFAISAATRVGLEPLMDAVTALLSGAGAGGEEGR
ncbi:MAG TPA: GTPase ObgE [Thermoanaerobaculia bacterium]|nr:GTPase ObgE [Thermoanaerobaculia bacterium]